VAQRSKEQSSDDEQANITVADRKFMPAKVNTSNGETCPGNCVNARIKKIPVTMKWHDVPTNVQCDTKDAVLEVTNNV
jgi:hypothetical protein